MSAAVVAQRVALSPSRVAASFCPEPAVHVAPEVPAVVVQSLLRLLGFAPRALNPRRIGLGAASRADVVELDPL